MSDRRIFIVIGCMSMVLIPMHAMRPVMPAYVRFYSEKERDLCSDCVQTVMVRSTPRDALQLHNLFLSASYTERYHAECEYAGMRVVFNQSGNVITVIRMDDASEKEHRCTTNFKGFSKHLSTLLQAHGFLRI